MTAEELVAFVMEKTTKRWKVFALPTTFLLDASGRVRHVLTGPTEWDEGEALEIIESMLAELPNRTNSIDSGTLTSR